MGKRSAVVELLLGNMGSMQWEIRPSMQREDQPTMATKLEQIAVKARREPNLRFTSLAHHITRERVLKNLQQIPKHSAPGVDGQTVEGAKESFEEWIGPMLDSIHRQGYRAPNIRRVYILKPGKTEMSNAIRNGPPVLPHRTMLPRQVGSDDLLVCCRPGRDGSRHFDPDYSFRSIDEQLRSPSSPELHEPLQCT